MAGADRRCHALGQDDDIALCYFSFMTLSDLEKAVAELGSDDLASFRAWLEEFEAARFDEKIERDAKSGKLDRLADAALDELRRGRAR
jgi:hypothetical protein